MNLILCPKTDSILCPKTNSIFRQKSTRFFAQQPTRFLICPKPTPFFYTNQLDSLPKNQLNFSTKINSILCPKSDSIFSSALNYKEVWSLLLHGAHAHSVCQSVSQSVGKRNTTHEHMNKSTDKLEQGMQLCLLS